MPTIRLMLKTSLETNPASETAFFSSKGGRESHTPSLLKTFIEQAMSNAWSAIVTRVIKRPIVSCCHMGFTQFSSLLVASSQVPLFLVY